LPFCNSHRTKVTSATVSGRSFGIGGLVSIRPLLSTCRDHLHCNQPTTWPPTPETSSPCPAQPPRRIPHRRPSVLVDLPATAATWVMWQRIPAPDGMASCGYVRQRLTTCGNSWQLAGTRCPVTRPTWQGVETAERCGNRGKVWKPWKGVETVETVETVERRGNRGKAWKPWKRWKKIG
jgi:hypothetical protein